MGNSPQVFQTANKKRWFAAKWSFRIFALGLILVLSLVVFGMVYSSKPNMLSLHKLTGDYENYTPASNLKKTASFATYKKGLYAVQNHKPTINTNNSKPTDLVRGAFYVPWSPLSLTDLKNNGSQLNTIYPEWFFIDTTNFALQTRIDKAGLDLMRQQNLKIEPILNNFHTRANNAGDFDGALLSKILHNTALQDKLIQQLTDTLIAYGFSGVNIDFEEIAETNNAYLTNFQKKLFAALHAKNLHVSMDVPVRNSDYDYKALANFSDYLILMAYDQYSTIDEAGPISNQKWVEGELDWLSTLVNPNKIILGLAAYGRQWQKSNNETHLIDLTYTEAIAQAKVAKATVLFDNDGYNLHYNYYFTGNADEPASTNKVWFVDAITTYNLCRFSDDYGTAGTALWRLGSEDNRIWNFYGRNLSTNSLQKNAFNYDALTTIPANAELKPTAVGSGELINVLYAPQNGIVNLVVNKEENAIAEEYYQRIPSGYIYQKFAEDTSSIGPNHKIILTFDDGPDPVYTPKILDILEREKVPASFFVVGMNAEQNIPLLQRINKDGFEIGNHSFTHSNLAKMSADRVYYELQATRSLIECITGKSTLLFRAPYNADSEPQTFEEIDPLEKSKAQNYISVGESIDPNDWKENTTAQEIVNKTINLAEQTNASIILLHDAGGKTRQATIDALPQIIRYFKSKGCKFTTIADLMGIPKSSVMPSVQTTWKTNLNYYFAFITYNFKKIVLFLFLSGIILSILRTIIIAIIAKKQSTKENIAANNKHALIPLANKTSLPEVSIIVPAHNEEVNAIGTINSLLEQTYPNQNIIFVDDGSTDKTFEKVSSHFKNNDRVTILTKPNGGKASALNYGIAVAKAPYVICIDADTHLKHDAVAQLMSVFLENESENEGTVGAVAGNVKVGNEVNLLTKWQSIEYITSQNFDRRAFAYLNCITVVPGALGAFSKEAITKAGGFTTDTLAEDCDLTMRLLKAGYIVKNCNTAISYTEAPEKLSQFLKQRFRWSFGVLQSFWKHKHAFFNKKFGNFGLVALPNILIYQILLPFLAPIADLILIASIIAGAFNIVGVDKLHIVWFYLIFSVVDIAGAVFAFWLEGESLRKLIWMIPQRLVYRQLMYYVLIKSCRRAIKGETQNWGILKRTGKVGQKLTLQ